MTTCAIPAVPARHPKTRRLVPILALAFLVASGCGGDDGGGDSSAEVPTVVSFTASNSLVTGTVPTELGYSFFGGTGSIDHGIGNIVSGETKVVEPTQTTTYTLTVTSPAGTAASRSITITVVPAPTITSFSATPATVMPGDTAMLSAVFADGVGTVDQGIGTVMSGAGVSTNALSATTTFTLTVANAAGSSVSATSTVVVSPFVPTGSMGTPRTDHTATLLPNGKVLIVGGFNGVSVLSSAELYDPATGTFTPTGSMNAARHAHAATLLKNGRVLIVGAVSNAGVWEPACELYDPASGLFSATGATVRPRIGGHTATLLSSGKVLIVGGAGGSVSDRQDNSAELYDPATGTFTLTGSTLRGSSIFSHTATLLESGKVLITGGFDGVFGSSVVSGAELYDPTSGTFSPTGVMNTGRIDHTATLLPDGRVLIAGRYYTGRPPVTAEIYDPNAASFAMTGPMNVAVLAKTTATLLPSGLVLIGGGSSTHVGEIADPELYDPSTGTFTLIGPLRTPRTNHTATLLPNGSVLIAGGSVPFANDQISSAELYE